MMLELKQNKLVKKREWKNTPKELGIWGLVEKERELGVSGKGKGKGPIGKVPRQR